VVAAPVVVFALEWCEFCWALRKFFAALDVPHTVVALDAMALQKGEMGLRMRRALTRTTGVATIPQVFVGGAFIGGCTDVFEAYEKGQLRAQLAAAGVLVHPSKDVVPSDLLPKWIHPRAMAPA